MKMILTVAFAMSLSQMTFAEDKAMTGTTPTSGKTMQKDMPKTESKGMMMNSEEMMKMCKTMHKKMTDDSCATMMKSCEGSADMMKCMKDNHGMKK